MILNPETLGRIRNCEMKVRDGEDMLTIPEVFDTLSKTIFSELDGVDDVSINALKQNLQTNYLDRLMRMTLRHRGGPRIVQGLAREQLNGLATRIEGRIDRASDDYTRAHLRDSLRRVRGTLEADYRAE